MTQMEEPKNRKSAPTLTYVGTFALKPTNAPEGSYTLRDGSHADALPVEVASFIKGEAGATLTRSAHAAAMAVAEKKATRAEIRVAKTGDGWYVVRVARNGKAADSPMKAGVPILLDGGAFPAAPVVKA